MKKKKMKLKGASLLLVLILFLTLFTACASAGGELQQAPNSTAELPPTELPLSAPDEVPLPSSTPTPEQAPPSLEPIEFPPPSSDMFGLEGLYAVLFDAEVDYWYALYEKNMIDTSDRLFIPYIGLIDYYVADNGDTHYICYVWEYHYYYLSEIADDFEHPRYGLGIVPTCFTVAENEDGELTCTDVLTCDDGEGWPESIYRLCGPLENVAEAIIRYSGHYDDFPLEVVDIVPRKSAELWTIYIDYCFR